MIVPKSKEAETEAHGEENSLELLHSTQASSSQLPPTFEESSDHTLVEFSQSNVPSQSGGEAPPPEFAPYEAEYSITGNGTIVSHDKHLNEDGEALYRFLLAQAANRPTFVLHCTGSHTETRTRLVTHTNKHGKMKQKTETYNETIRDFDFYIDIGQHIATGPVNWSMADSEPAYRGLMIREVDFPEGRRKADKKERKDFKAWRKEREARGLPPWHDWTNNQHGPQNGTILKSTRTLREWADNYCASPKYLKEFTYEKVVHGWNVDALRSAVRSAITSTHYRGNVNVEFELSANKVCIRSNNHLSRALSKIWVKVLLWIFLIYPFIWLYKRFHSHGGGRWEVCGGAYGLKHVEPIGWDEPPVDETSQSSTSRTNQRVVRTASGASRVTGLREGEWFQEWEGTIKAAVRGRRQSDIPMYLPEHVPTAEAVLLDGYTTTTLR